MLCFAIYQPPVDVVQKITKPKLHVHSLVFVRLLVDLYTFFIFRELLQLLLFEIDGATLQVAEAKIFVDELLLFLILLEECSFCTIVLQDCNIPSAN